MITNRIATFPATVMRLVFVFTLFMAYAGVWRITLDHPQWGQALPALAVGGLSGFAAFSMALAMPRAPSGSWRDRLCTVIPEAFGAAGLFMILFAFPGAFCRMWFTGFLVALPASFAAMCFVTMRSSRRLDQMSLSLKRVVAQQ